MTFPSLFVVHCNNQQRFEFPEDCGQQVINIARVNRRKENNVQISIPYLNFLEGFWRVSKKVINSITFPFLRYNRRLCLVTNACLILLFSESLYISGCTLINPKTSSVREMKWAISLSD
jgi:hypothetical protein